MNLWIWWKNCDFLSWKCVWQPGSWSAFWEQMAKNQKCRRWACLGRASKLNLGIILAWHVSVPLVQCIWIDWLSCLSMSHRFDWWRLLTRKGHGEATWSCLLFDNYSWLDGHGLTTRFYRRFLHRFFQSLVNVKFPLIFLIWWFLNGCRVSMLC